MNRFCYQCQETGNRKGCISEGVCGKIDEAANLQDVLIYSLKGLAFYMKQITDEKAVRRSGMLSVECLFATVTNTNFDPKRILKYIKRVFAEREDAIKLISGEDWINKGATAIGEIRDNDSIGRLKNQLAGGFSIIC